MEKLVTELDMCKLVSIRMYICINVFLGLSFICSFVLK